MIQSIYQPDCNLWHLIDDNTGKIIRRVQYADDERGDYIILKLDKNGEVEFCKCQKCGDSHVIKEKKHGNIKLVRKSKEE